MNIRATEQRDYEGIAQLLRSTLNMGNYFTEERFTQMLERNKGYCFVAEDAGKIIGNVFAMHDGAFAGYIYRVAVDENCRRQGIASQLVQRVCQALESDGISLIFLHTERDNKTAIDLFTSLGFEERKTHILLDKGYVKREHSW